MMKWRERIVIPSGINTKYGPARLSVLRRVLGDPTGDLTADCRNSFSPDLVKRHVTTMDVGPFVVTGLIPFLETWKQILAVYQEKFPEQAADLTTAGVWCARLVRGSNSWPSTHTWACAIDLGFGGVVDRLGDGSCYRGLLDLYSIAKQYGMYWGASFSREDSMHFEASSELLLKWEKEGRFK